MPPPIPWPTMHALVDAQLVEQLHDALGVGANVDGAIERTIAASVAQQIDDDDAMPGAA